MPFPPLTFSIRASPTFAAIMQEYRPGRFQVLPVIVKNLIIINVIMVLLELTLFSTLRIDLGDYLALHYWRSGLFRPWQLLTHMFMHGSADPAQFQGTILHIGLNMLGLWMFGSVMERVWGPQRFLVFYLFCGIGAALCQWGIDAWHLEPIVKAMNAQGGLAQQDLQNALHAHPGDAARTIFDTPMVGASGAIFGVLLAFAWIFPNAMVYAYLFVPLKAKWAIIIFAAIELATGFYNSPGDNVAHFAHLGGMLFGFIFIKIWGAHPSRRIG